MAGTLRARLAATTTDELLADGLHSFVRDTLAEVIGLHAATAAAYGF